MIREHILSVMRATGQPLRARDIAIALTEHLGTLVTTNKVAAELSKMGKKGLAKRFTICVGEPKHYGIYAFPEGGSTTVWAIPETYSAAKMRKVRDEARMYKRLPKAVMPAAPIPATDDMRQMIEDIRNITEDLGRRAS